MSIDPKLLNKMLLENCPESRTKVAKYAAPLIKSMMKLSIERRKQLLEELARLVEDGPDKLYEG